MNSKTYKISALTLAVGAALAVSGNASASANPFAMKELSGSSLQVASQGKCGASKAEGKCGASKSEGKCGANKSHEGKCGASKSEGKCGANKSYEGKCGASKSEGKCGANKSRSGANNLHDYLGH